MKNRSLESVMADMMRRLSASEEQSRTHADSHTEVSGAWGSVFEALLSSDSILAALYKEYLESRIRWKKLVQSHGGHDPMVSVAADMLDSAYGAIETRLIELRTHIEGDASGESRALFFENCRRLSARKIAAENRESRLRREKKRRERERDGEMLFWVLMFSWIMKQTVAVTRRTLSAAHDFALVSQEPARRAYSA